MTDIVIDKTKTISDNEMYRRRNILKIKLHDSRLPRENVLLAKLTPNQINKKLEIMQNETESD